MSDNNTSTGQESEDSTAQPEGGEANDSRIETLQAELQEAINARKNAVRRAQKAEGDLGNLKNQIAKDAGDIDAIVASYEGKLQERDSQLEEARKQTERAVIDRDVLEEASQYLTSPELFLETNRHRFKVDIDDKGRSRTRVKDSADTTTDLIKAFGEKHPGLRRSDLKPGIGTKKTTTVVDSGEEPTIAEMNTMSQAERLAVFKAYPHLIDKVLGG